MTAPPRTHSRRSTLKAAAWTVPVVAFAAPAPAMAASPPHQQFGMTFDGRGGGNGALNAAYLNLRSATGSEITLTAPVTIIVDVVAISGNGEAERDFTAGSSKGDIDRADYDQATRTTRLTWTIPADTDVPTSRTGASNPRILFSWRDGLATGGRITNKIVVRSISGGQITEPGPLPLDSTVYKDEGVLSPDGIY